MSEANLSEFLDVADGETAKATIDRYHAFLDAALPSPDDAARWRLRTGTPVRAATIASAEKRLRVRLPPSYVEFVTQHGLISGPGEYAAMFAPAKLITLHDYLRKQVFAPGTDLAEELGLDAAGIDRLDKLICFASGQYEELFDFFDLEAADPDTGEAPVSCFDRQDIGTLQDAATKLEGRAFDLHLRSRVDFNIREVMKRLNT